MEENNFFSSENPERSAKNINAYSDNLHDLWSGKKWTKHSFSPGSRGETIWPEGQITDSIILPSCRSRPTFAHSRHRKAITEGSRHNLTRTANGAVRFLKGGVLHVPGFRMNMERGRSSSYFPVDVSGHSGVNLWKTFLPLLSQVEIEVEALAFFTLLPRPFSGFFSMAFTVRHEEL